MLPSWLDSSPWSLLLEGGSHGVPYSYFINFKTFDDSYTFYITDLATIWTETCNSESIKSKLAPYENFLELSVQDLLRILTEMFSKPETISKLFLQPGGDEELTVECGTQLGFVKFNWSFECKLVDRRLAAQHIRAKFTLPAILAAGSYSVDVDTNVRAVSKEQYQYFLSRKSSEKPSYVLFKPDSPASTTEKVIMSPQAAVKEPEKSSPSVLAPEPSPNSLTKVSPVDAELERRKQLELMLAANKAKANEKKRKLI